MCPTFELAAADSASESTVDCSVLKALDSEHRYKPKRTDRDSVFVLDPAIVLLSINENQGEEDVTFVIYVLKSAAFDSEVFRSFLKMRWTVEISVSKERRSIS